MINDKVIATTEDGRNLYDNTPTVICVAIRQGENVIAIRRNTEPGKGLWALPGGYHMHGETWQEAGAREVFEELGLILLPKNIKQICPIITDHYGNNVIRAIYYVNPYDMLRVEIMDMLNQKRIYNKEEVQEIKIFDEIELIQSSGFWAFSTHYEAASIALKNTSI